MGPEFSVGAMLPDLAEAAGTELRWDVPEGELLWGAMLGRATHQAYYDSPIHRNLVISMGGHLATLNAYRCDQASLNLLLDGFLLENQPAVGDGYRQTLAWLQGDYEKVGQVATDPDAMTRYLEDFSYRGVPAYLMNPVGVASQLSQRFAIENPNDGQPSRLPGLIERLQVNVKNSATALLANVIAGIRAS